ncbi:hypothetical protein COOONC_02221 [Cooperia oncophora]
MNALKSMYRKCVDIEELERIGSQRLLQSYGVWPMVDGDDKWRVEDFDLTSLMIHVSKVRGLNVFVTNYVSLDNRNVSRRLVKFDQADLGLGENSREYYMDSAKYGRKLEAYRRLLIGEVRLIHEYANLTINSTKIESDVNEILEFETKIAKIMEDEDSRRDCAKMYNLRRLSDMKKLTPMIDWFRYFKTIAPNSVRKYFATNPNILIVETDYMRRY